MTQKIRPLKTPTSVQRRYSIDPHLRSRRHLALGRVTCLADYLINLLRNHLMDKSWAQMCTLPAVNSPTRRIKKVWFRSITDRKLSRWWTALPLAVMCSFSVMHCLDCVLAEFCLLSSSFRAYPNEDWTHKQLIGWKNLAPLLGKSRNVYWLEYRIWFLFSGYLLKRFLNICCQANFNIVLIIRIDSQQAGVARIRVKLSLY